MLSVPCPTLTKSRLSFSSDRSCTTKEMYYRSSSQMATTPLCNMSSMRFYHFIMQSGDALHVSSSASFTRRETNDFFVKPKAAEIALQISFNGSAFVSDVLAQYVGVTRYGAHLDECSSNIQGSLLAGWAKESESSLSYLRSSSEQLEASSFVKGPPLLRYTRRQTRQTSS